MVKKIKTFIFFSLASLPKLFILDILNVTMSRKKNSMSFLMQKLKSYLLLNCDIVADMRQSICSIAIIMIIFDCSVIIDGNPHFESPINVRGSKTYLSDGPRRWLGKKAKKIISKGRILPYENANFLSFLEICKLGDFDRQISP